MGPKRPEICVNRGMHLHGKAGAWAKEFIQLFRGPIVMELYRKPPEHYLGYVLDGKVPVILIPGILNKWGYMKKLGDKISMLGHPVHIIPELGTNLDTIPSSAKTLHKIVLRVVPAAHRHIHEHAEALRAYLEKKDIRGAVIVAHSKGGLIGKYFLAHFNTDTRVLGMVAIATPFSGSALAKLIPHRAFKELHNESQVIKDLQQHNGINKKIISVYPSYDTHIWAPEGSYLPGAENIEVPIGGHSVVDNGQVQEAVIAAVERITRLAAAFS